MTIRVEPAVALAGQSIRVIVEVDVAATRLPRGGIAARGWKRPRALVIGSGRAQRLIGLDGTEPDLADFGLTRQDIE